MIRSFVTGFDSPGIRHSVTARFLVRCGAPHGALLRRGPFLSRSACLLLGVIHCAAALELCANEVTVRDDAGLR